ncbi:uncharacterized protein [Dermacentor andersoni]|uniref:uncharacterized protein n=1 Tax=Dermacentor andersoni TaxID=34620 RepID=UPI003B3B6FEB
MAVSTLTQRGYDPDAMSWTTVPTTEEPNSAIPSNIRSQALLNAAARRLQEKAKMVAPAAAPASGNPAGKTQPPASHSAGSKGKVFTKWKPRPLLKPNPDDYVIVVKPREHIYLHEAFSENRYGTAFTAYLGSERAETASILPSREQNLIVIHTPDLETADRVIGDFSVNTERGAVPLHGYLRQDGGDVCHGVIVVCNSDTTETLQQKVRWRAGTIVEVRKFGTSNKARVTFAGKDKPRFVHYDNMVVPVQPYYRTIPACGKCGAVGHRMDACPNLRQDTCGLCGQQIPLVEGVRAPHECVPKCSVCGGGHATNSRECTAKFRNSKIAAQKGGKTKTAVKKELPGRSPHRDVTKTGKLAPPAGEAGRQSTAPPHGVAGAWADAVKKGKQVSGAGRAASSSPPSTPPAALSAEQNMIAALQAQNEMLLKKITALEAKLTQPHPTPAVEVMESETEAPAEAPSAVAALEARINALEARMDSRICALETQISAAMNAAIAKLTETIPSLITQQIAQTSRTTRRAGPIKDVSGRYPKMFRRQLDFDDEDSCSLSGMEDAPLPVSAGDGTSSSQPPTNLTDHGGHP